MFAKSGWTVVYETPSAKLSEYVQVEVATARFLEGLDKRIVLISKEDFLALAGHSAMHVVNMPTPTPSATPTPVGVLDNSSSFPLTFGKLAALTLLPLIVTLAGIFSTKNFLFLT